MTAFSFTPSNVLSQNAKVKIDVDKTLSVEEVFELIKEQTDYKFIYQDGIFKNFPKIEVKKGVVKANELLQRSLSSGNFYVILSSDNTILVKEKTLIEIKQQSQISGIVTDESGMPLAGASIIEKGSSNGAQSDFDGQFSLNIFSPNTTLVVSYIGFVTQEISTNGKTNFSIILKQDTAELDEIVLIGYGQKKSRNITGAVSKINYENLKDQNITSFEQALSGQIPGVQIAETTGAPGGNVSVRIRGVGSISSGQEPLYVIDGVPLDNDLRGSAGGDSFEQPTNPLASINPEDIQSISVLKDAASTAIYGSRGANGVIIIETKSGKKGRIKINYKGTFSVQSILRKVDLLDAYEYADLVIDGQNENYINNNPGGNPDRAITDPNGLRNRAPIFPILFPYAAGIQGLTNTDWQDEIFRVALTSNHNVSVSGGSDHSNYYVSGNFLDQEGIVINSEYKRYAFRMKYNVNYDNIQFGINLAPSYTDNDIVQSEGPANRDGGGLVQAANTYGPIFPVYNPDGTFNYGNNNFFNRPDQINPVAIATLLDDRKQQFRLLANAFISFKILEGLTYKGSIGIDVNNFKRDTYNPIALERRGELENTGFGRTRSDFVSNYVIDNTLTYKKQFGDFHNIDAVLGTSAQKNRTERNFARTAGFPNDLVQTLNAATIAESAFSNGSEWSILSYFARLEYNYDEKYLFSVSGRTDGSSRFAKNTKWGYFPSASLGWIVSKENFFGEGNVINFLKLRGSYGSNGNFDIGNYEHIALLDSENYVFGSEENIVNGLTKGNLSNDKLTWETTTSWDLGLNISFLNNKFELEADYYDAISKDFLFNVPLEPHTGFESFRENRGEIKNSGIEIALTYHEKIGNLEITANANFSKNKNEVLELGPEGNRIITSGAVSDATYVTQIGDPIGSYFLYVEDGVFANQAEVDAVPHFAGARPGDIRYVDTDGDGDIDSEDRQIVGNYNPDYLLGGSLNLKYKNFDLGISVNSSQGSEILNLNRRFTANPSGNFNNYVDSVNRWRSESDPGNGQVPRARSSTGRNTLISTRYIEDGSFVRIQNIAIGFNLPSKIAEDLSISNARLSVNVQNPFLWTNYTGYNPEVNSRPNSATSAGEDYGSFPLAKSFTIGINVAF
tara:strand:- start:7165 stop:10557 length:3393 start_codon:yes stop_codon:yes gene_type:complete